MTMNAPKDTSVTAASLGAKLHEALFNRDFVLADQLIDAGADLETKTQLEMTPLQFCLLRGDESAPIVEKLLQHGANSEACTHPTFTRPLQEASFRGYTNIVRALIKYNADLSASTHDDQRTSLMLAIDNKHFDIANMLIDAGAPMDAQNAKGWTASMYAAYHGIGDGYKTLEKLILLGADVGIKNIHGDTVLTLHSITDAAANTVINALQKRIDIEKAAMAQKEAFKDWTRQGCPLQTPAPLIAKIRLKSPKTP